MEEALSEEYHDHSWKNQQKSNNRGATGHVLDIGHLHEVAGQVRVDGEGEGGDDRVGEHAGDEKGGDELPAGEDDGHVQKSCDLLVAQYAKHAPVVLEAEFVAAQEEGDEGQMKNVEEVDDEDGEEGRVVVSQV